MNFLKRTALSLLLCLAISIPAWFLGKSFPVIGGPVFAILIGMVLTLILKEKEPFTAELTIPPKNTAGRCYFSWIRNEFISNTCRRKAVFADHNFHDHNIAYHCIYFI